MATYTAGKCYENHKPYVVGDVTIHGGSCIFPKEGADIYIGFDQNMRMRPYRPWAGEDHPNDIYYYIQDMSVPTDPEDFKKLAEWTIEQIREGKVVHCGCIGGHGRTGTFLALITQLIAPELNAIDHVRNNYCKSAVETTGQEKFLITNYGCAVPTSKGKHASLGYGFGNHGSLSKSKPKDPADNISITPVDAPYCVFNK